MGLATWCTPLVALWITYRRDVEMVILKVFGVVIALVATFLSTLKSEALELSDCGGQDELTLCFDLRVQEKIRGALLLKQSVNPSDKNVAVILPFSISETSYNPASLATWGE